MRKPGVRTKVNTISMQHVQKENRQKRSVSAGFLAGAEGLGLRCRSGRFVACVPPARTHSSARGFGVDVETRKREKGRSGIGRFSRKSRRQTVLSREKPSPKHPEKQENHKIVPNKLTGFDKARIIKSAGNFPAGRLLQTGG